jgi:thimet oligopeptidase
MRTAGEACDREVNKYVTDLSLNRELYDAIAAVKTDGTDANTRRFHEKILRDFRRSGVDKDEATRTRLKQLAEEAVLLGQEFDRNIRDDVRSIKIDPEKLAGLPDDYKAAHPPGADGKVTITTDYPDYLPFRSYADDAVARRALYVEFNTRGYPKNEAVLRKLLANKAERAKLLGYPDWAAYQLDVMMAKDPKTVQTFIDKVHTVTNKRAKADYKELLARKKKDDKKATKVEDWERVYYEEKVKKDSYAFDAQKVRPYFEFKQTRDGLLAITSRLYEIQYKPVPDAEADKWHDSVDVYDVMRGDEKLGRIYLDLHPREGKFKHAAQFPIKDGVKGRQLPEGALICNFPDPRVSQGPALMDHDDVETLFHEFGHLMHHIFAGKQEWTYFSGVATEWDFVESPSMMFEEWAWDPTTLALFAKHHETGEVIPEALLEPMRKARKFGLGVGTQRQLQYAKMSFDYHQADPKAVDLDRVEVAAHDRYTLFDHVDGVHIWAGFGHLNGYDAAYYTYVWSQVIAKDLLSPFLKKGLLDDATARLYRDTILAPGGSKDAADLVKDFLGRPYDFESYRKWLEGK